MSGERKLISYEGVDCKCKHKSNRDVELYQSGRANGDMRVRLRHTFHSVTGSNNRISNATSKNKQGRMAVIRAQLQKRNFLPARELDIYDTLRLANDSVLAIVKKLTAVFGKGSSALLHAALCSIRIVEAYKQLVICDYWIEDPESISGVTSDLDSSIEELRVFLDELDTICKDLAAAIRALLDVAQKGSRGYVDCDKTSQAHKNKLAASGIATAVGAGISLLAGGNSVPTVLGVAAGSLYSYRSYLFATDARGEGQDFRQHCVYALETVRSGHYLKNAALDFFKEITLLRQRLIDARPFSEKFTIMTGAHFRACLIWMTNDDLVQYYKNQLSQVHMECYNITSARENEIDRIPDGVAIMKHTFGRV